ncbi:hypothetical protein KIPB_012373, partial [Kipferlia bialata]|eukprot:g12373.t1
MSNWGQGPQRGFPPQHMNGRPMPPPQGYPQGPPTQQPGFPQGPSPQLRGQFAGNQGFRPQVPPGPGQQPYHNTPRGGMMQPPFPRPGMPPQMQTPMGAQPHPLHTPSPGYGRQGFQQGTPMGQGMMAPSPGQGLMAPYPYTLFMYV